MAPYIIGIDLGTGSTKGVAMDYAGKVVGSSQIHYSMLDTPHGLSEQDPEVIWKAFVNCVKEITATLQQVPVAVSLSSCMHSLILIDKNNQPLGNLITWADTRSEDIAGELRSSKNAEAIYRETGTPIHSMSPLCKIIWFKENSSEIFDIAFKFISIKEFIWYRLFNAYQVDQSIASATGLFDINNFEWSINSLKLCNITAGHLSEIVATDYIRNDLSFSLAKELNISASTQFCVGASDGCLANIGSFALEKKTAAITIGTSGAVRISNASPVYNYEAMIFNYVLDSTSFICGGPVNNGGNVLEWMMKSFLKISDPGDKEYDNFFNEVDTVTPGAAGLLFLPYLHGERAPIWDESASGVFFGVKSFHDRSHFLRASLEGVCYALKNILQIIEQSTGIIDQLNVSGGFIHSKTWVQILADVTGKKICTVQTEDASAIGAAMLAMKAMNIIKNYETLKPKENSIIHPAEDTNHAHEKNYIVFKKLYGEVKNLMHIINI